MTTTEICAGIQLAWDVAYHPIFRYTFLVAVFEYTYLYSWAWFA